MNESNTEDNQALAADRSFRVMPLAEKLIATLKTEPDEVVRVAAFELLAATPPFTPFMRREVYKRDAKAREERRKQEAESK